MAKTKKRFNRKARQSDRSADDRKTDANNEQTNKKNKIQIEIEFDETKYDESNQLVLDNDSNTKTNKSKTSTKSIQKTKVLSKKQRKKLEKVLQRKNRKINRAKILNDLQKFKVKNEEIKLLSSTSDVQTGGRKRLIDLKLVNNSTEESPEVSTKRRRYPKVESLKKDSNELEKDLNVISVSDVSQSEDSESSESEDSDNAEEVDNEIVEREEKSEEKPQTVSCETKPVESETKKEEKLEKCEKPVNPFTKERIFVLINRSTEIEKSRSALPIVSEEHSIMDAINNNPVVIICGETGSGKTTQVPQFLYEAGFTQNGSMIGVTEPRRVAAIAMSQRVGHEMNLSCDVVSYQIRFETNVTSETRIKFMTDGVLLKEIQNDFLLSKYSVIIIDEAHERSLHSDILIGLLSRIVPLRNKKQNPLKLIIMSATLRVEDFISNDRLFRTVPPVMKIDSRQYPVSVHFNKKTNSDYLLEAFKKVCKIHNECPSGGILVFLTGRLEVEVLCRKLRAKYPYNKSIESHERKPTTRNEREKKKKSEKIKTEEKTKTINLDDYEVNPLKSDRISEDFDYSDDESDEENDEMLGEMEEDGDRESAERQALYCLPLYSMLSQSQQTLIFKEPPAGTRLCVVATNIAETSITIPNIKYVVDSGKVKTKVYDSVTGISTFIVGWTSKASADQRAGRAGRTGPGHCYRLYSSAIFNDEFPKYSEPEIIRKPSDDLILQMKALNIENVVNFPFPTQPSNQSLIASERRLIQMGALKEIKNGFAKNKKTNIALKSQITELGRAMSHFPVSPRYAKMLALSRQHRLMPYTIAIVSALTIQELFVNNEKSRKKWSFNGNELLLGDAMIYLNAIGAAQHAGLSEEFCRKNGFRYKAMVEVNKLRKQLNSQINTFCEELNLSLDISPPTDVQIKLLRQILLSGLFDRVARKVPELDIDLDDKEKKKLKNSYQSIEVEKPVFISSHSVLSDNLPHYVVYQEIFETTKLQMRNVVAIEPEWLPLFVADSCKLSNPLESPPPRYDQTSDSIKCYRSATFGPYEWPISATELPFPEGLEKYKYFAKFLLEGDVISFFKSYSKQLLSSPSIIIKSWASLQPRTQKILNSLLSQRIDNKKGLLNKWKTDSKYLLKEYLDWLPQSVHQNVTTCWPPVQ